MTRKKKGLFQGIKKTKNKIVYVDIPDISTVWPFSSIGSTIASIARGLGKVTGKLSERQGRSNPTRDRDLAVLQKQYDNEWNWNNGVLVDSPKEEKD